MAVTAGGNVDPQELQFRGGHDGVEPGIGTGEHVGQRLGHSIAGRDQSVDPTAMRCALADGMDRRVAGAAAIVDHDATACADLEAAAASQLVARPDAGCDNEDVDVE